MLAIARNPITWIASLALIAGFAMFTLLPSQQSARTTAITNLTTGVSGTKAVVLAATAQPFTYLGNSFSVHAVSENDGCRLDLKGPALNKTGWFNKSCLDIGKMEKEDVIALLKKEFEQGTGLTINFWDLCATALKTLIAGG